MSLRAWGAASVGAGAAAVATAAGACCVPILAPLLVSVLGVGGSIWAASLEAYAPYLLSVSGLLVGYGFWSVYRRPREVTCVLDSTAGGGRPAPARQRPVALRALVWLGGAVWLFALCLQILRFLARTLR